VLGPFPPSGFFPGEVFGCSPFLSSSVLLFLSRPLWMLLESSLRSFWPTSNTIEGPGTPLSSAQSTFSFTFWQCSRTTGPVLSFYRSPLCLLAFFHVETHAGVFRNTLSHSTWARRSPLCWDRCRLRCGSLLKIVRLSTSRPCEASFRSPRVDPSFFSIWRAQAFSYPSSTKNRATQGLPLLPDSCLTFYNGAFY